jgi:formylglycine-generating enzyme required for sulfatase activity
MSSGLIPLKGDPSKPVDSVSWNDVCAPTTGFLARLNAAYPDIVFRLPTEAEWEYACRAGTTTRFYWGDDPDCKQIRDYAWYFGNSEESARPVGRKKPNSWGLCDMSGNGWEWCSDRYGPYTSSAVTDPAGSPRGSFRVLRGGSWNGSGRDSRSGSRDGPEPDARYGDTGFRLVCTYRDR